MGAGRLAPASMEGGRNDGLRCASSASPPPGPAQFIRVIFRNQQACLAVLLRIQSNPIRSRNDSVGWFGEEDAAAAPRLATYLAAIDAVGLPSHDSRP